jgi:hypothetical protein
MDTEEDTFVLTCVLVEIFTRVGSRIHSAQDGGSQHDALWRCARVLVGRV